MGLRGLDNVKSWMSFMGWRDGGGPGSVKKDADDKVIAYHGDATWIADVQDCCDKAEREAAREEIIRREDFRAPLAPPPVYGASGLSNACEQDEGA